MKKQLRFDEAERFITTAFQLFDERQDTMALAVVTALLLGCRASEVLQLRVQPGAIDGARTERLVQMLDLDAAKAASRPPSPSAEQLLASLPPETLARRLELASQTLEQKA